MLMLDKTSERLRTKHVRTLELLQKTLDENVELRDRVSQLQKGTLHLSQGEPRSNRANELEDEIDRLKAEHCAKQLATEEAFRVRHEELFKTIEALQNQQQKLQNDVFSLETRLFNARETLQHERAQWHQERQQLQHNNQVLQQEIDRSANGRETHEERHQLEIGTLERELELLSVRHNDSELRNEQLREEITALCKELKQQKDELIQQTQQLNAAHHQIMAAKQVSEALVSELASEREQKCELEDRLIQLQKAPSPEEQPKPILVPSVVIHPQQHVMQQQYTSAQAQLHQMEEQHTRLVGENHALQASLTKIQSQLNELSRTPKGTDANAPNGSIFATHIDLKRENFTLRAQVEELKQLQRRFLTTANKKTMKFPPI